MGDKSDEQIAYEAHRTKELSEHYVSKWIDEQGFPKDEEELVQLVDYAISCVKLIYEMDGHL